MFRIFYQFILLLGKASFFITSFFNEKHKKWIEGQKHGLEKIKSEFKNSFPSNIWIHAASLGEYEQIKPFISDFKIKHRHKVVLTIFSSSAYDVATKEAIADHVYYLPLDLYKNSEALLESIQPKMVFFVKYEFWINYCFSIKKRKIPFFSISTRIYDDHLFFKWYAKPFRSALNCFTHFFTQDHHSKTLLSKLGYDNVTYAGDTRYDRVAEILVNKKEVIAAKQFKSNNHLLVVGSSWIEDIMLLLPFLNNIPNNWKVLIAPHEVNEGSITQLKRKLETVSNELYSERGELDSKILIIDNIGLLSSIYQYADLAYVGGAFGDGLHNIMEPAVFGVPVIFGPNYSKFPEAKDFITEKIGFSVKNSVEFDQLIIKLINNHLYRIQTAEKAKTYIQKRRGATDCILSHCTSVLVDRNDDLS